MPSPTPESRKADINSIMADLVKKSDEFNEKHKGDKGFEPFLVHPQAREHAAKGGYSNPEAEKKYPHPEAEEYYQSQGGKSPAQKLYPSQAN